MSNFSKINLLASTLNGIGACSIGRFLLSRFYGSYIRVLNYHHVPLEQMDSFAAQIDFLLSKFDPATPEDLKNILAGKAEKSRPRFIVTFDDGLQSQATYVADYLKSRGIVGWFFVPTAAPDVPQENQHTWAIEHQIIRPHERADVDGLVFASWEAWRGVNQSHVVACHTHDHVRFEDKLSANEVNDQLTTGYEKLNLKLGITERVFCWVGGELGSYSPQAAQEVAKLNTELAFTTCSLPVTSRTHPLRIERTNLESSFTMARVKMSTSGIVDLRYMSKRNKLDQYFSYG